MYASHIDNFIYKHYAEKLNEKYNKFVEENETDENIIAYRTNKTHFGKSNIHYAAEVISNIHSLESCYVLLGDFKGYFDSLKHDLLKEKLCKVLGVSQLTEDWYKVFKSVTKYSYYNKRVLNKYCGSDRKIRRNKQFKYFKNPKEFRGFKRKYPIQTNENDYGIPQGTAISALLSNVYAIEFDKNLSELVEKYNGIYKRYSDDFIIIIPECLIGPNQAFNELKDKVFELVDKEELEIREDKTGVYHFNNGNIINQKTNEKDKIDYLGFVFDGQKVKMRAKSPYKFYRNAYKTIKKAHKTKQKKSLNKLPYRRKIYRLYTDYGVDQGSYGNFIKYALNSQKTFDDLSPQTNNLIMEQMKNRRKKIEQKLGYKISIK